MTTETTAPTPPISGQLPAIKALASLAAEHETLPEAYILINDAYKSPLRVGLQLQTPHDFEQWRAALDIPAADVTLHTTVSNTWLSADTTYQGVTVHLSGFYVPLTREELTAPRDTSEVAA